MRAIPPRSVWGRWGEGVLDMLLVSENKILDAKSYFGDVVPQISEMTLNSDGIFVARLVLSPEGLVLSEDEARRYRGQLVRIVVAYFNDNGKFSGYWNSDERLGIWACGSEFANFCDVVVSSDGAIDEGAAISMAHQMRVQAFKLRKLGLSQREAEVLYWICNGRRNEEIARLLGVRLCTVKKHACSIFDKLGVDTRLAAANVANDFLYGEGAAFVRQVV